MFPKRFYGTRFYAKRYFPHVGATPGAVTYFDGMTSSLMLMRVGH